MFFYKFLAASAHKKLYGHRCKINPGLKYFSHTDFKDLNRDDFSFTSRFNDVVRGGIYYKDGCRDDVLVIFVHGNGAGHTAYMKEINYLTDHHFKVLSYDVTGTLESDGGCLRGFYQHPSDLEDLINYLSTDNYYKNTPIYLVGHSWGGYTVLNSLHFINNENVKKIVSISGLRSMESTFKEHSNRKLHRAIKYMMDIEEKIYGKNVYFDACDYINKCQTPLLLIHSDDDPVVNYEYNFKKMISYIDGNELIKYVTVHERLHNPTYTKESVEKLKEYLKCVNKLKSDKEKITLRDQTDFNEFTRMDDDIMHLIINFLNK